MSWSESPTKEHAMRLIQITDSHLGPDSEELLLGLNTDDSLIDVLQLIAAEQTAVDALVCTGDIASNPHTGGHTHRIWWREKRASACVRHLRPLYGSGGQY